MRRTLGTTLATAAAVLGLATSATAGVTIGSLTATLRPAAVAVAGTAAFGGDATPVELATDGQDTGTQGQAPGTNLTGASISRKSATDPTLTFSVAVANIPSGGVPNLYYTWSFDVLDEAQDPAGSFTLLASSTSVRDIHENQTADFRLWTCPPDDFCDEIEKQLVGRIENGVVEWDVPLGKIDAQPGYTILENPFEGDDVFASVGGVTADFGVATPDAGAGYAEGTAGAPQDDIAGLEEYTIPGASVKVGIAPAGTALESVALSKTATVAADGSFTATLMKPRTAGEHVVVAKACYTTQDCAIASTPLTI